MKKLHILALISGLSIGQSFLGASENESTGTEKKSESDELVQEKNENNTVLKVKKAKGLMWNRVFGK